MTKTIIVPQEYEPLLKDSKNRACIMGLSVGKQDFLDSYIMQAYSQFMQNNFIFGLFIIADFPKKYNIMALEKVSEGVAMKRASVAGDDLRNGLERITRQYPFVKVSRWNHFRNELYDENLSVLRDSYKADNEFRHLIDMQTFDFLNLPANKSKWDSENPPIEICKEYVLDELALLASIPCSFSIPVCEIYPLRNITQELIHQGKFSFCKKLNMKQDRTFLQAYCEDKAL